MNAVGTIGEFIITYQYEIEIGLLILLGLIILFAIIRAFARAVKRKTVLEEISEKVNDISEALTAIADESAGGEKAEKAEKAEVSAVTEKADAENVQAAGGNEEKENMPEVREIKAAGPEPEVCETIEEPAGDAGFVPKKYFSRDCSTDKNGNHYTLEELENQIR